MATGKLLPQSSRTLEAFARPQEGGMSFEEAHGRCLAQFASLSQKGFARDPRELLERAKWSLRVTAFLGRASNCAVERVDSLFSSQPGESQP